MTALILAAHAAPLFNASLKRHGGMWFWRLGRLGGCLYVSRREA